MGTRRGDEPQRLERPASPRETSAVSASHRRCTCVRMFAIAASSAARPASPPAVTAGAALPQQQGRVARSGHIGERSRGAAAANATRRGSRMRTWPLFVAGLAGALPAMLPAQDGKPDPAHLVAQLATEQRAAAHGRLVELGAAALPALTAGLGTGADDVTIELAGILREIGAPAGGAVPALHQ